MKIHKTNAMRLLDQHKVTYQVRDYSSTGALSEIRRPLCLCHSGGSQPGFEEGRACRR